MKVYSESDKEYLSRPLLNVEFLISDTYISVTSESTLYICVALPKKEKLDDFNKLYSQLIQLCREKGVKVVYKYGYKKYVNNHWKEYLEAYKQYKEIFEKLYAETLILQERGIHIGNVDDEHLTKCINLRNQMLPFFYRSGIMYGLSSITRGIKDDINAVTCSNDKEKVNKIYL